MRRKQTQGFTLLELSIVLVIIGLLIGGIFVGQSLIHNAQLNAVITEFNKYQTSVQSFKQQYQALPGDMNNATQFWGAADGSTGNTAGCATTASTTALTCNGNGDGVVFTSSSSTETYRFWQHLANAKMIEGSYSGTPAATVSIVPGSNTPVSKYPSTTWTIYPGSNFSAGDTARFAGDYGSGHVLLDGGVCQSVDYVSECGVFTPRDAWAIDKKVDDGRPAQGNVLSNWNGGCTNAIDKTTSTATYSIGTAGIITCTMYFLANF